MGKSWYKLSWIKKFVHIFKNEEEDNEQDPVNRETERKMESSSETDSLKDMNARVMYQYPKGQFRFPLIPDENLESKPKRKNARVHQEKSEHPPTRIIEKKSEARKPVHRQQEMRQDDSKQPTKIESSRKYGSFRPTEIPSPIHGYQRPNSKVVKSTEPKQAVPIEYELHNWTASNDKTDDELFEKESSLLEKGKEKDFYPDHHHENDRIIKEEVHFEERFERGITEEVSELIFAQEPDEETDEFSVVSELAEEPDSNSIEVELEKVSFDNSIEIHTQELPQELGLEKAEHHNEGSVQNAEDDLVECKEENGITTLLAQDSEYVNNEHNEDAVSEARRRKHIPFNVMMLNQDKQRLLKSSEITEEKNPADTGSSIEELTQDKAWSSKKEIEEDEENAYYVFPTNDLLKQAVKQEETSEWLTEQEERLNSTLINFNVGANVVNVTQGPSVTRFEVQPEPGVKVNKITNLSDDIKLSLAARDIRIEAPIPGKHTIGIEVPNKTSRPVFISEIINSSVFINHSSPLTAVLGLDIAGNPIVTDLRKMPHGLIAGATGSGKSVCINSILVSLLYKANPDELKLILIDPKMVELAPYNGIPHLVSPVITDVKAATAALKWAVEEMERRYELFAHTGVREINRYNELAEEHKRYAERLPFIVIIIDELADLMMMSPADVEEAICRIAQKARACGIHLIIATQRPSVDVITGLIKANVPTRIAFSVSSQIDSRTIIDISGAEKLLGRGDMLFLENGSSKPVRLQGTFVSDNEIDDVVAHVKRERKPEYLFEQEELLKKAQVVEEEDELFYEACEFIVEQGVASTSSLQRRFKIGYNRAARLIDMMESQGFISEGRGSRPREVHLTEEDLDTLLRGSTIN